MSQGERYAPRIGARDSTNPPGPAGGRVCGEGPDLRRCTPAFCSASLLFSEACLNLPLKSWPPVPVPLGFLPLWVPPGGRDTHLGWEPGTPRPPRVQRRGCREGPDPRRRTTASSLTCQLLSQACLNLPGNPGRLSPSHGCPQGQKHAPRVGATDSTTPPGRARGLPGRP